MEMTRIVITGGPCAGKSTAMSWIQNTFTQMGYTVLFVPETATELITGGVAPWTCGSNIAYQTCQFRLQLAKEEVFRQAAETMDVPKVLIVCDRGALDNKAYMTGEEFAQVLAGLGTNEIELRDNYDAVFHLVTAAKGAEEFYTTANNTARRETPEEAAALDDKLISAWTGHPHLRVIGNDCGFEEKINRVLKEIAHVLGVPQPIEIERKYLVELTGEIPNSNVSEIKQTYLLPIDGQERRLRMRGENGHNVYFLTTKIRLAADRSYEHECQISENRYLELLREANPAKRTVVKHRTCFLWKDQYFELDEFLEPKLDHLMLEIEDAEDEASVKFPPFLRVIKDVTGDAAYYNSNIAKI